MQSQLEMPKAACHLRSQVEIPEIHRRHIIDLWMLIIGFFNINSRRIWCQEHWLFNNNSDIYQWPWFHGWRSNKNNVLHHPNPWKFKDGRNFLSFLVLYRTLLINSYALAINKRHDYAAGKTILHTKVIQLLKISKTA